MVSDLFSPFVDEKTRAVDSRLLSALGLRADVEYKGELEKRLHAEEDTSFDFYLEGPGGERVFFEVMHSENGFASCDDDERNSRMFDTQYRPHLADHVDSKWLEKAAFLSHHQILRNISYLGRYPKSGLAFIFPKSNESLRDGEEAIKRIVSKSLAPRVAILYLENVVARILTLVQGDAALTDHFLQFKDKYLVATTS